MAKEPAKKSSAFFTDLETVQEDVSKHEYEYKQEHTHKHKYEQKRERRSKRMNLLVKPSTVDDLKVISERQDRSMNDIVNDLIEAFIEDNK